MLLSLVAVALAVLTFVVVPGGTVRIVATVIVGGTALIVALLVGKALTGVAKTALYVYATEQTAPEFFEDVDFGRLGGDEDDDRGTSRQARAGRI